MKLIGKSVALIALLVLCLVSAVFVMSLEDKPLLHHRADLTPERIAEGKRVFERNDPRRLKSGTVTRVRLSEHDLDLAINYAANQLLNGIAGLSVDNGLATVEATLRVPENPIGNFLNIKLEFRQANALPEIDHVSVGKLWIPGFLAKRIVGYAVVAASSAESRQSLIAAVKRVEFQRKQVVVTYRWRDDLPGEIGGVLWADSDQKRLEIYQSRLAELTQGGKTRLGLTALLGPLARLAGDRSQRDAVAENRALILVLAFYVNQKDLSKLMPLASSWPRPHWRTVTLSGRDDFTKHYLVSAMLAAYAGTPLADAVGLYKEIEDARGGSGFSFNDIAADRAGRLMGELATKSETLAKRVQKRLAGAKESDLMPATADLPEFMPEAEFQRRFGGIGGEKYRRMMTEIDRRIAALAINR